MLNSSRIFLRSALHFLAYLLFIIVDFINICLAKDFMDLQDI